MECFDNDVEELLSENTKRVIDLSVAYVPTIFI